MCCKGEKMKALKKKAVSAIVALAKNGVKNDINSTTSGWMYQPKLPKEADRFKKTEK